MRTWRKHQSLFQYSEIGCFLFHDAVNAPIESMAISGSGSGFLYGTSVTRTPDTVQPSA